MLIVVDAVWISRERERESSRGPLKVSVDIVVNTVFFLKSNKRCCSHYLPIGIDKKLLYFVIREREGGREGGRERGREGERERERGEGRERKRYVKKREGKKERERQKETERNIRPAGK